MKYGVNSKWEKQDVSDVAEIYEVRATQDHRCCLAQQ